MDIKELKQLAVSNGLCKKWETRWRDDWTEHDVMNMLMSFDGIEFIAKNAFPPIGTLERATKEIAEKYDLYIKKVNDVTLKGFTYKSHFVSCKCNIVVPDNYIGIIYISRGSNAIVKVGNNCDIIVKYTSDDYVVIESDETSMVKIVKLQKEIEHECKV